jgi:hypothetical protein
MNQQYEFCVAGKTRRRDPAVKPSGCSVQHDGMPGQARAMALMCGGVLNLSKK